MPPSAFEVDMFRPKGKGVYRSGDRPDRTGIGRTHRVRGPASLYMLCSALRAVRPKRKLRLCDKTEG